MLIYLPIGIQHQFPPRMLTQISDTQPARGYTGPHESHLQLKYIKDHPTRVSTHGVC